MLINTRLISTCKELNELFEVLTIMMSLLNAVCSTGVYEAGYSLPCIYYEFLHMQKFTTGIFM